MVLNAKLALFNYYFNGRGLPLYQIASAALRVAVLMGILSGMGINRFEE